MTQPRRHIAGQVAMLTRSCAQRCFFLHLDDFIIDFLAYEPGKAAEKQGQQVYAAVAMPSHVHFCVGDTIADRSKFMQETMSGIPLAPNHVLEHRCSRLHAVL